MPFLVKRDLRGAFTAMLQDTKAVQKSLIKVENIKAPILLISATEDEIAPTTPMCDKIMSRLKQHSFKYYTEHVAIIGSHAESLQHFELVFNFLKHKFPVKQ